MLSAGTGAADFDPVAAAAVIDAALALRGGADLVIGALAGLPYAEHTPARKGFFSSAPEHLQLGQWRFTAAGGRLQAAHVVGGIALSDEVLPADECGERIAAALAQYLGEHGARQLPEVLAVLAGLAAASR